MFLSFVETFFSRLASSHLECFHACIPLFWNWSFLVLKSSPPEQGSQPFLLAAGKLQPLQHSLQQADRHVNVMGTSPRGTGIEEKGAQEAELPLLLDTWNYHELMRVLQSLTTEKKRKVLKVALDVLYIAPGKSSVNAVHVRD